MQETERTFSTATQAGSGKASAAIIPSTLLLSRLLSVADDTSNGNSREDKGTGGVHIYCLWRWLRLVLATVGLLVASIRGLWLLRVVTTLTRGRA